MWLMNRTLRRRLSRPRWRHRAVVSVETIEARILLSTIVVSSTDDNGPGTLRQAILAANEDSSPDVIDFNLGAGGHQAITLTSALPEISNTLTIDGTSQPGYSGSPLVEINGAGLDINTLTLRAANCVVEGLVLNNLGSGAGGSAIRDLGGGARIQGNFIGTDWTGTAVVPVGTGIEASQLELIGGTDPGQKNLISGCRSFGVIVGNSGMTVIEGNFIGTNAAGTAPLPNSYGIYITPDGGPRGNVIGGTAQGAGNLISGNTVAGISGTSSGVRNLAIQGNKIGTDVSGTSAVGNTTGIQVWGQVLIGGTDAGAGNLISGNTQLGVFAATNVRVQGNKIGTDITGTSALGNLTGIVAWDGTVIGGATDSARNVIGGNVFDTGANTTGTLFQGNYLGTDITGEVALTTGTSVRNCYHSTFLNNLIASQVLDVSNVSNCVFQGNTIGANKERTDHIGGSGVGNGAVTFDGVGNMVGGTASGTGNFIRGGVLLWHPGTTGNVLEGNDIDMVEVLDGASGNQIGGTDARAGNRLGYIRVENGVGQPHPVGIAILGNTFDPASKPIVLAENGVGDVGTVNDPGDGDSGPNGAQNYPVLANAYAGPSSTAVGTLNSIPGDTFRIEFYASPAGGPAGQGRAARYLGSTTVTTDASGNASFTVTGLGTSVVGEQIDATATVLTGANGGSTSEFSVWTDAKPLPPSSLSGVAFSDFNHDGQVDFGEKGIAGVTVTLDGTDILGNTVHLSQATDSAGAYVFQNLIPGSYTVTQPQVPAGYRSGVNTVGTGGGTVSGTTFTVSLTAGDDAMNYNYGEQPAATGQIRAGQTAGIGFWNNKNGQALIKGLNGGVGTQLGDWLAATFPHMFGSLSGSNSLAGKSNAYVASFFQSRFIVHGQKLDAQVLATALSVYVTDPTLDDTGIGSTYGFLVSGNGLATSTFNVGGDGAAFAVTNNTTTTVMDILLAADTQAVNGVLYNGNTIRRSQANDIFSAINEAGD